MGKAPAVIIIARHGARLDAEDPQWLANSATPYDPPLSYGGWTQTRALGGRIASLLHERDLALNEADADTALHGAEDVEISPSNGHASPLTTPKRRKHTVIIHSSPFLRCVQSSIAISAGMSQYQGNLRKFEAKAASTKKVKPSRLFTPSRSHTVDASTFDSRYGPASSATSEGPDSPKTLDPRADTEFMKPTLRIDACLGEWLSPDYFEFITAPPSSNMMVAGAKADLLRHATPIQGTRPVDDPSSDPPPLDLDGRSVIESIDRLNLTGHSKPSSSQDAELSNGSRTTNTSKHIPGSRHRSISKGYVPPVPGYAIATTASIPPGYVAHAREACVKIDFQWDSMRLPQEWGDGGEHGEEWSSMHKRFRKGLMGMMSWYKMRGPFYDPQAEGKTPMPEDHLEDDEDIILVIVTHGAGCNALIGALTNQPVLLDVGMASLTMAVHKNPSYSRKYDNSSNIAATSSRKFSVDCSQSAEYSMRFVASMDHLRAGRDPLKIPLLQSPRVSASVVEAGRRASASASSSSISSAPPPEPERSRNTAIGSVRRSRATTATDSRTWSRDYALPSPTPTGLWGSRQPTAMSTEMSLTEESEPSEGNTTDESHASASRIKDPPPPPPPPHESPVLPPSTAARPSTANPTTNTTTTSATTVAPAPTIPTRSASKKGLWGSGPKNTPPRRWTSIGQN